MDDLDALIDNLNTAQNITTSNNENTDILNKKNKENYQSYNNINISSTKCKNCGSNSLIYNHDTAMLICQNCGVCDQSNSYSDESMDHEQITYSITKLLTNVQVSRIIGLTNPYLRNLHLWNSVDYNTRNIITTFKLIKQKSELLKLKKCVIDDIKILYYNVIIKYYNKNKASKDTKKKVSRGKNKLGLIAACTYHACKTAGIMKNIKEIAEVYEIKTSCMNNGCKKFLKLLKVSSIPFETTITKPSNFINVLSIEFGIPSDKIDIYTNIIHKIESNYLITTHTPYTIAVAASIYYWVKINDNLNKLPYDKLKTEIKKKSKSLKCSGTIILNLYNLILTYDSYLLGDAELEIVQEDDTEIRKSINDKLKFIENLNPDDYKTLNNIDIHTITLRRDEDIFNNNFFRNLKYLL